MGDRVLDVRKKLLVAAVPLVLGAETLGYGPFWAVGEAVGMYLWIIPVGANLIGLRQVRRLRWSVPLYSWMWATVVFPLMAFFLFQFNVAVGWVVGATVVVTALLTWFFWPGRWARSAAAEAESEAESEAETEAEPGGAVP